MAKIVITLLDGVLEIPVLDQIGPGEVSFTLQMLGETFSQLKGIMYSGNQLVKAELVRPNETIDLFAEA